MPTPPTLPARAALFLDFDGTLVEIAPTPDAIVVPPTLPPLLTRVAARLEGAVAIVSGRRLAELDAFLPGGLAKAAEHGAVLRRLPQDAPEQLALPSPPADWRVRAAALVAGHPGALLEDKSHGFVLHYRLAPVAGPACRALLDTLVRESRGFSILEAHMAWELRPDGASKGGAVRRLMRDAPFAGRTPVFIGDDVTDEEGMDAARAFGGQGWRLQDAFGSPPALHAWLAAMAE